MWYCGCNVVVLRWYCGGTNVVLWRDRGGTYNCSPVTVHGGLYIPPDPLISLIRVAPFQSLL